MIKLSDFVINFIEQLGVKHIFMLPGGGCMHLVDSLGKNKRLQYICNLHEQASAIAAEAYGQYTNNLGVALVTTGPGGTNTITGLAGAWIDSTPMLIISGQAKKEDMLTGRGIRQMGIQEVDIISVVSPITKYAVTVMEPEMIKFHLQKAVYEACNGRKGPVWLDMPLDVQGAIVNENKLKEFKPPKPSSEAEKKAIKTASKILEALASAKRPVILAGNGIRLSNAMTESLKFFENIGVPILTTWKMTDFVPENHPLYCGRPGMVGQRGANFTQQSADCLLILGARLDLCQTGFNHPNFAKNARKIIVDIDQKEIDKLDMKFELALSGDIAKVIKHCLNLSDKYSFDFSKWLSFCKGLHRKYPVILPEYKKSSGPVNTYHLLDVLSEILTGKDLIVPGSSGACAELTQQAFKIKKGQRLLNTPGLGAMGFDLSAAIGACIASGERRTIGIAGDGGFQMNIQELQTLKRLDLPIKMFVLNNGGYGSIQAMQKNRFDGNYVACNAESGLTLPDIVAVAKAYGLKAVRIKDQSDLKNEIKKVLDLNGPVICDVMVDPDVPTAPRLSSEVLPDGRIVSKPMEDLWPFLERDEFNQNMTGKI
jgi:acetolactate synthase-1/2/3 large subunit